MLHDDHSHRWRCLLAVSTKLGDDGLYEIGILSLSSIFLFGAYYLSVVALRHGGVSLVGPFRYALILWSLLVGFLIWGDIPDFIALTGMALIAAAGLLVLRSEYRQ
jgi:drug/metabolite transporter (DMT)-like permease